MAGSLCGPGCAWCGRCNAPEDEDPMEPGDDEQPPEDCPTCGAHVHGKWAEVETVPLSYGSPSEHEPRCFQCGTSKRIREQVWDIFSRE